MKVDSIYISTKRSYKGVLKNSTKTPKCNESSTKKVVFHFPNRPYPIRLHFNFVVFSILSLLLISIYTFHRAAKRTVSDWVREIKENEMDVLHGSY